jgi:hypothetical protein
MENPKQFLKELHDLLDKYNVEISVGLDGDTHGVSADIVIDYRPDPKSFKYETILKLHEVTAYDLKPHVGIK